jgi:hypothetical protein
MLECHETKINCQDQGNTLKQSAPLTPKLLANSKRVSIRKVSPRGQQLKDGTLPRNYQIMGKGLQLIRLEDWARHYKRKDLLLALNTQLIVPKVLQVQAHITLKKTTEKDPTIELAHKKLALT